MNGETPNQKPTKPWTLSAIRDKNLQIETACKEPGCGWLATYDTGRMIEEFGDDFVLPTQGAGLTCGRCGAPVDFGLALVKPDR